MEQTAFEGLEVVRRACGAEAGDAEVCRGRDGTALVRLRVRDGACQRACLAGGLPATARLERGVLELLYPCPEGASLGEWLFTRAPGLGERRDACLALLAQCVAEGAPGCVLALSARVDNLRFSAGSARLLYLADWGAWRGEVSQKGAVGRVAALCREILTRGLPRRAALPPELALILRRVGDGDYDGWGKLQRDLAALPDALPAREGAGRRALGRLKKRAAGLWRPAVCLLTAAAVALALASLAGEGERRRQSRAALWPGMGAVAGEEWGEEP